MKTTVKFGLIILALSAGGAGAWFGNFNLHAWQQRRLIAIAQSFLARDDLASASLSAQQALVLDPNNAVACRLLVQIAEREKSPSAILWLQKLAKIDARNVDVLIELADYATRIGELFVAEQAMSQVPERARDTVAYQQMAGTCAIAAKHYAEADEHFQKALRLDPHSETLQINLATLRMGMATGTVADEARATLETLRSQPKFHRAAATALLMDARRRGDQPRTAELAAELKNAPDATTDDQLLYLEELQHAHSPDFQTQLHAFQDKVSTDAPLVYGLLSWMNAHGLSAESISWAERLPVGIQLRTPVPLAIAEACTVQVDWKRLSDLVTTTEWGALDFLRFALQARVIDETSFHVRVPEFRTKWDRAVISTHGDINELSMLARLVEGWGWKTEAVQVWWIIANQPAGQRDALKSLYRLVAAQRNTMELYRVARRIYQVEPSNPGAKNNVAILALLLDKDLREANQLAEANYRAFPTQPGVVSTYAFSLKLRGQTKEAIEVMSKLTEEDLREPSMAACNGVLLAAGGQYEKARPFLNSALKQKDTLLPEEIALVEGALRQAQ